jgi:hypothetical protein
LRHIAVVRIIARDRVMTIYRSYEIPAIPFARIRACRERSFRLAGASA